LTIRVGLPPDFRRLSVALEVDGAMTRGGGAAREGWSSWPEVRLEIAVDGRVEWWVKKLTMGSWEMDGWRCGLGSCQAASSESVWQSGDPRLVRGAFCGISAQGGVGGDGRAAGWRWW
jgi:hypothetical protein